MRGALWTQQRHWLGTGKISQGSGAARAQPRVLVSISVTPQVRREDERLS